ncbi:QueT transporter family protein [uncultured Megasphaera sp.]|uniref:QueT transporter family protein n=1 Tax=uncultured Megasphaera sp. TaxID=165188 RepID=UPI002657C3C5|nr:QueT transporter family protein [uncultured Megasphaera sp.]
MYNFLKTPRRMTISAMVIALYIVLLYLTQSISFGAYQIRIATALYALAFLYPFLVIPMGVANLLANFLFGGLGPIDMIGGCFVGMATTALIVQVRQRGWNVWLAALPIWLVPTLVVSLWLSQLLHLPYSMLVVSLAVGQAPPAVCGVFLIHGLARQTWYIHKEKSL